MTVLCPRCKAQPVEQGRTLCAGCAERSAGHPAPLWNERTYQEPVPVGGVYQCPKCDAPLEPGAKGCAACLVEFMRPVPEVRLTPSGAFAPYKSAARKKPLPWGALVGAALLLAALGFGFHAYKASIIVTHPLATRLRVFHKGDFWEYRVNGFITVSGEMTALLGEGNAATVRDGTFRSVISAAAPGTPRNTYSQDDTIAVTLSHRGRGVPLAYTDHGTFSQDPVQATTYLLSDQKAPNLENRRVLRPQVDTPGAWTNGTTQSVHLDFDDNQGRDETMTVQGSEVVDTALGRFTVWRCVHDQINSDGTKYHETLWFAPQLGMPVKSTQTLTITKRVPNPLLGHDEVVTSVATAENEITKTNVPLD